MGIKIAMGSYLASYHIIKSHLNFNVLYSYALKCTGCDDNGGAWDGNDNACVGDGGGGGGSGGGGGGDSGGDGGGNDDDGGGGDGGGGGSGGDSGGYGSGSGSGSGSDGGDSGGDGDGDGDVGDGGGDVDGDGSNGDSVGTIDSCGNGSNELSTTLISGAVGFGVGIVIVGGGTCVLLVFIFKKKRTKLDGTYPSFIYSLENSDEFFHVSILIPDDLIPANNLSFNSKKLPDRNLNIQYISICQAIYRAHACLKRGVY